MSDVAGSELPLDDLITEHGMKFKDIPFTETLLEMMSIAQNMVNIYGLFERNFGDSAHMDISHDDLYDVTFVFRDPSEGRRVSIFRRDIRLTIGVVVIVILDAFLDDSGSVRSYRFYCDKTGTFREE